MVSRGFPGGLRIHRFCSSRMPAIAALVSCFRLQEVSLIAFFFILP
jgi:hypothetical protein